ncbi:hypothetical protein IAQ61_011645 [Plenodomus lingam]|uniref:Peroxidase n=1 Tax=Leptosphaeria maculans (strain JN3 / isolate v23.1.3 / race Av1-4-5-6-7-8) TaxID=985895 RepID=E5AAP9_LEPMJ|nr:hypothetical protein LEMA_P018700.1 [Plenodomus lingam JN3]KAH9859863.1 hypothetical protein IAQ61_011645 [Plenodomus lingam]CBY00740.1 hypothetical protein LEMA_P018700.1 [Plenodomus lingam JN3]
MKWDLIAKLALVAPASAEYVWPAKTDAMDDLLFNQAGYNRNGALSDQVKDCAFGALEPGIQKSAEWLRTAFHDAVTYDKDAKTGGLDASIQYELDRQENLGSALNSTLADIASSVNVHNSAADLIALSMVMAVARCGDLRVPLRTGRKDATVAGPMGVPEAHTDLETSRRRFEMATFNQSEMITLIACGHTIGAVHSVDHPEIVSGTPAPENIAHFDTTNDSFDNAVVTEFLNNSTTNPLVVNTNDTLNSDKRIFNSDGHATMKRLMDPAHFKAQCEVLLERMIDVVPGDVQLSEPLRPSEIRPYIDVYQLDTNGSIQFSGSVRVRVSADTGRDSEALTVALLPTYHDGKEGAVISTTPARWQGGMSSGYLREVFKWHEFSQTLPANQALKTFNLRLDNTTFDNAGTGGYPVNPDILYQLRQSCIKYDLESLPQNGTLTIVAAVSKSLLSTGAVPKIRVIHRIEQPRNFIPALKPEVIEMKRSDKETNEYVYYTVDANVRSNSLETSFDLEAGDSKVEFLRTDQLQGGKLCEPL